MDYKKYKSQTANFNLTDFNIVSKLHQNEKSEKNDLNSKKRKEKRQQ